jgi:hypothetical protein
MVIFRYMDKRRTAKSVGPARGHRLAEAPRDSRGTKIDRVSGPGPKDAGKGAAGKAAKDRLDRNH